MPLLRFDSIAVCIHQRVGIDQGVPLAVVQYDSLINLTLCFLPASDYDLQIFDRVLFAHDVRD